MKVNCDWEIEGECESEGKVNIIFKSFSLKWLVIYGDQQKGFSARRYIRGDLLVKANVYSFYHIYVGSLSFILGDIDTEAAVLLNFHFCVLVMNEHIF